MTIGELPRSHLTQQRRIDEMTTKEAAELYESQHLTRWIDKQSRVYNPKEMAIEDLPVIYGFSDGPVSSTGFLAVALSQDGHCLATHGCSSEAYMPHDLSMVDGADHKHEVYADHYPDGYRCEFVTSKIQGAHTDLQKAMKLYIIMGSVQAGQRNGGLLRAHGPCRSGGVADMYKKLDKLIVAAVRKSHKTLLSDPAVAEEANRISEATKRGQWRVIDDRVQALRSAGLIVYRTAPVGKSGWYIQQKGDGA